ncbi:MAG TPA: hypothetical protein VMG60_09255 [Burkholderiaceae bacterium]|nr:hypothetical protein [Burkholderiaceae bacterium]
MATITNQQLSLLAAAPAAGTNQANTSTSGSGNSNFFEALASAWASALDNQANTLQQDSANISQDGNDQPSAITQLTADSLKFGFLTQSAQTSISSVGEGESTMGRKQ